MGNKLDNPEMDPCIYAHGSESGKYRLFNKKCWDNWVSQEAVRKLIFKRENFFKPSTRNYAKKS